MSAALRLFKADGVALLLAGLGLAPLLGLFGRGLWQRPAYQFFPLGVAAAGLLTWRAARQLPPVAPPGSPRLGRLLLGAGGLVFVAANLLWSPWLGLLAVLLLLLAGAWSWGGRRGLQRFLPTLLMLLCIIPPPLGWDQEVTRWLGAVSVNASSSLLDFLQVVHVRQGNTILLPGKALLLAEACSGINSVVLCGGLCLFYALWQRRPLVWLLALLPLTTGFVVLGNVLRITTGAALYYYRQIDWLSGRPHEVFGLALLLGYGLLVLSLDQGLVFLRHPLPAAPATPPAPLPRRHFVSHCVSALLGTWALPGKVGDQRVLMKGMGTARPQFWSGDSAENAGDEAVPAPVKGLHAYALMGDKVQDKVEDKELGVIQTPWQRTAGAPKGLRNTCWFLAVVGIGTLVARLLLHGAQAGPVTPSFAKPRELHLVLPAQVAGWQQLGNAPQKTLAATLGVRSFVWRFAREGVEAAVAVDYPLGDFHNVALCYQMAGWQILAEEPLRLQQNGATLPALRETMQRSGSENALVFHAVMNERGQWLLPPVPQSALKARLLGSAPTESQTTYRIQVLTGGYNHVTADVVEGTRQLFLQSSQLLRQQMLNQFSGTP